MKSVVSKVLGWIFYPLFAILFIFELYRTALMVYSDYTYFYGLAIGMAVYFIVGLFMKKNKVWMQTFSHELTHTLVGMLFFRKIHSFTAGEGEGVITHSAQKVRFGSLMISLSPYFLPIFTIFLLLLRLIIDPECLFGYDIAVGITYAFHLSCFRAQTGSYQTDLQKHGLAFSYLVIITFHALVTSIVLMSIDTNLWPALKIYAVNCYNDIVWLINAVSALF